MSLAELRLETPRLILRVPRIEDFDRFAELQGDADAARHIGGAVSRTEAWRRFLWQPGAWQVQGFGMFAVIERDSGSWLGQTGPWRPEGWPGNEIGYAFHPDVWGRGYALEAATAAIDWSLQALGWDEFIHCIAPENAASQKLATRLGSTLRGPAALPPPHAHMTVDVWGQTRAQWLRNSARNVSPGNPRSIT